MNQRTHCWFCGVLTRSARDLAAATSWNPGDPQPPYMRTREHVLPISRGGTGATVCACSRCNGEKGNMTLEEYRTALGGGTFFFETVGWELPEAAQAQPSTKSTAGQPYHPFMDGRRKGGKQKGHLVEAPSLGTDNRTPPHYTRWKG